MLAAGARGLNGTFPIREGLERAFGQELPLLFEEMVQLALSELPNFRAHILSNPSQLIGNTDVLN
jgi:hypothetical protein